MSLRLARPTLAAALAACVLALATAGPAAAQDGPWPSKPVRIVVPFPPGGAADTFARLIAEYAGKSLGQPFVAENRPGAGGQIATDFVAKAPADGHTMLVVTVGHAVTPSLYPKLPYDTLGDLAPVARIADLPSVLVVNPGVPATTVQELVALMKSKPDGLAYASSGNATTSHVAGAMLAAQAGVKALHVPYKGSAPAVTDLIGGQVQWMIDPVLSSAQHVKAGKLRALAVSTAKRSNVVPGLPTIAESGLPGYDFSAWFVLLAPARTPPAVVERMHREVERMLALPEVKERFVQLGAEPGSGSPAQVGAFLAAEVKRYATVVRDANMKAD
ncbi:MAG TPA: tripartite tricarboxylate transporter substrate binding protein [Burkholderiaceae bacterium]|nr:tripartite tricarboxylate transporter substrate binding protein [Burkholderiaceae bacterium]